VGPHEGLRYSGEIAGKAYAQLSVEDVDRVFLLGPSHYQSFVGVALPASDLRAYGTPLGELAIDREAVERLRGRPGFQGPADAHDPEHSLEMHAIFIAARLPGVKIVPLVVGRVPDSRAARNLASRIGPLLRRGDVVIASSDFTHYGARFRYLPFRDRIPERLEELLDGAAQPLVSLDPEGFARHVAATGDTICGREPSRIRLALLNLLPEGSTRGEEVARDTSGRMTGDYAHSVSYLSVAYRNPKGWDAARTIPAEPRDESPHGRAQGALHRPQRPAVAEIGVLEPEAERLALTMARHTLQIYLETGRVPGEADLGVPEAGPFRETLAAFVTLKRDGHLRGCIGHIWPVQPLWCDIRDNAIAAAVRDQRFPPVSAEELPILQVEVSVLTPPRPIPGPQAFEVGRHGIVLQALGRRAVFLPQVAPEQGWDRETALSYLARKAGLYPLGWQHPEARLQVFEAQVFAEPTPAL
jgi:AmmeMemoRadiSam system protein A/AmmeMemoRadiSam system protein B